MYFAPAGVVLTSFEVVTNRFKIFPFNYPGMNMEAPDLLFPSSAHSRDKAPGKIGGCVGTFLQLFDWNPRKRLFSTKRLPAERPNGRKASSTKKKYKDERMPVAKLLLLADEENRGGFPSPKKMSSASSTERNNSDELVGKRVPGVVARLMGLESLPVELGSEGKLSPQHPKALPPMEVRPLQELLHSRQESAALSEMVREREYLDAKKLSLKERLNVPVPGFASKGAESAPPVSHMSHMASKDGFKKPQLRSDPHLQPYSDPKFQKSLRPLKKTSRDLTDTKHLILALSPRASGEGLRPILLPSKVHNKLMSSPSKSPTKLGSRSARLLEAAVKILEPSLQPNTARARAPPARPSVASSRDFRDFEREMEEKREKLSGLTDKKVALPTNAARVLKGQSMSRSWNGREDAGKYGHDLRNGSSFHDSGKKRNEQAPTSHSRTSSPLRSTQRTRSSSVRGSAPQEEMIMKAMDEIKNVVPQGFEEAYGGGLKPLNVSRKEESRLDKYGIDDRRISEKHVVSSLSSLSSVSVANSPYSECSERSTTSSYQDSLRRSGSVKEGLAPSAPYASKSRFMRSKSVKEEKSSKLSSGGGGNGPQLSHNHNRPSTRDIRVKQEIPQQAHHSYQQSHPSRQPHLQSHLIQQFSAPEPHQLTLPTLLQANVKHQSSHAAHQPSNLSHQTSLMVDQQSNLTHQLCLPEHQQSHLTHQMSLPSNQGHHHPHLTHQMSLPSNQGHHHPHLAHQLSLPIHSQEGHILPPPPLTTGAMLSEKSIPQSMELTAVERELFQEALSRKSLAAISREKTSESRQVRDIPVVELPKAHVYEVEVSADESVSSRSSHVSSISHVSSAVSSKEIQSTRSSGGGLLSYSRLFGTRKNGERKSESKEKKKGRGEGSRKNESSLVRSLLRRKPSMHITPPATPPVPLQPIDKPKKRGGKKYSVSEPPSRELSDHETTGYYSEDYLIEADSDLADVIESVKNEVFPTEEFVHQEGYNGSDSPTKCVNDVFPEDPLDKGCLRLLEDFDETGSKRRVIEGFDCIDDDCNDKPRDGILNYAAQLLDDLELDEMFSTGSVIEGFGRNGFSYSPLVQIDDCLEGGLSEVEKSCVSFLGRTGGAASPEMSFTKREQLSQELREKDFLKQESRSRNHSMELLAKEVDAALIDDAKASFLQELSEARKIVDSALEEVTERASKRFTSIGRVSLADVDAIEAVCASVRSDDCGQPSPVSVLECPFEEDDSRSSQGNLHESISEVEEEYDVEDSLMDDFHYESASMTMDSRKKQSASKSRSILSVAQVDDEDIEESISNEKIVDAILDISRFRSIDPSDCGLVSETSESFQEEEEDYVEKILSVWELYPETSGHAELPITSTLFDRLESQGRALAWRREKEREEFGSPSPAAGPPDRTFKQWQSLWLHRRLLFDCVNETLAYRLKYKYPDPWLGIPMLRRKPEGIALVQDVYSEIKGWRDVQTEELDTIIEMDMGRGLGNWSNLHQEIGEIGLDIERAILRGMIEELVWEIMEGNSVATQCPSKSYVYQVDLS